jgi:hypothetical protein
MEELQMLPVNETNNKRPTLLTVLCILTFIGAGLNTFSNLVFFIFYDAFMKIVVEFMKTFKVTGMEMILDAKPIYFATGTLISALTLAGAVLMWQLRKLGFHIYTVSQILVILAPMFFFHLPGPDIYNILLSGAFVLLYSTKLKNMS